MRTGFKSACPEALRRIVVLLGCFASAALLGLLGSCSSIPGTIVRPVDVPGADYVGSHTCTECHSSHTRTFPASAHARMHFQPPAAGGDSSCEACHGPGSRHVAAGGGQGKFIVNPGRSPEACLTCHLATEAEFHFPHRHPVLEGQMNCVACHDPHGADIQKPAGGLAMSRQNETCAACHREQSRPFVFEHEALREGCTICHQPHGSVNPKLLLERDNNLCLKCHAQNQLPGQFLIGQIPHDVYVSMGTCWSAGCHTAVHGSNFNPRQLY